MMRWSPMVADGAREETDSLRADAAPAGPSPTGEPAALRDLLDAVLATVSSLGARSVVVLVMALIVAALVFGLSADEAAAGLQWCRACTGRDR